MSLKARALQQRTGLPAAAWLLAMTLVAFLIPLALFSLTPGRDWSYFDSISLVVASNIKHFKTLPLHNPWACGGLDLMSNPQTRIFAPTGLLDIFLPSHLANVLSLFLEGLFGSLGAYLFFREQRVRQSSALIGAALFVNASWFALHFAEGHIAFGGFQLVFWALYLGLRIDRPWRFAGFGALMDFLLLDGGMYPFIHSLLLLGSCYALGLGPNISKLGESLRRHWRIYATASVATALTACARLAPIVLAHASRETEKIHIQMTWDELARYFFNPLISVQTSVPGLPGIREHEMGCYVGVTAVALVLTTLWSPKARKRAWPWLLLCAFWVWVGSGMGAYNPWNIFEKIPIVNNLRVQSRIFLIALCALLVALTQALHAIQRHRRAYLSIGALLLIETVIAHTYSFADAYRGSADDIIGSRLITSSAIKMTTGYAHVPAHYFRGDAGSRECYEPCAGLPMAIESASPYYRGEAYASQGAGKVELESITPGRITLNALNVGEIPLVAQLNTKYLFGWTSDDATATPYRAESGLLAVSIKGTGPRKITLRYAPVYLNAVLAAQLLGFLAWISILWVRFCAKGKRWT